MTNSTLTREHPKSRSRRATVRYRCERAPTRRVFLLESYRTFSAEVHDLSLGGVGIVLDQPLPAGTLVFIDLVGMEVPLEFLARVVHSTTCDDGRFLIGCQFDRMLTQEELDTVLAVRK